jgi:hypothetical protein
MSTHPYGSIGTGTTLLFTSGYDDVWGSGGIAQPILNVALDGGDWSASRLDRFITSPRATLDAVKER